jgi:hypothetical protein
MAIDTAELDKMQSDYKTAVDEWIDAIHHEEELASTNHSEADIDEWELAGDAEEVARDKAKAAKQAYESALRREIFNF